MEDLNIEYQWLFYLNKVGLMQSDMPPQQIKETKRAFVAGLSQSFVLLIEGKLQDENSLDTFNKSIQEFWIKELNS